MIATSLTFLLALGATMAYHPFEGVDPNSLSCDPKGQIFLLLPHFEDCDKFYMCTHGKEVEFRCSEGTIFVFEQQTCDWSWAATCQLREKNIEGSSSEEGLDSSSEEGLDTSSEEGLSSSSEEGSGDSGELWSPHDDTQIGILDLLSAAAEVRPTAAEAHKFRTILDCENPVSAAKQLPYRGDCQRYWRCLNGLPQATFCSEGLFFNERTQQCDFEANSKCVDSQPTELGGEFIEYK